MAHCQPDRTQNRLRRQTCGHALGEFLEEGERSKDIQPECGQQCAWAGVPETIKGEAEPAEPAFISLLSRCPVMTDGRDLRLYFSEPK